ncbi:DUF3307 domain-containing protein [Aquimarina mytili]|uniref:DUF3307 domain-containing protein n=1 Tax=Aquimarina mytili TaxID=874423 RepID=A0A937D9T1_9FLAO|nr:DUF3307 domain-containing protein [Aquimarina mytili]MBL0682843.1 DUF3307 domain-containing protein [Aquimarina mytili]
MNFVWILLAHWVGDYAFQTSKMAVGKSHHFKWLILHVLTYSGVLLLCSLILFPIKVAISFLLINCILHGITDFFTSKLTSKYRKKPRIFFPIMGFDQLIHTATLYLTFLNRETLVFF